jgi:uncharacterized protein DUF6542
MTDPAGERPPRRRPSADAARGSASRPRSGTSGRPAKARTGRPVDGDGPDKSRKARRSSTQPAKTQPAKTKSAPRERPDPERGTGGRWPMADRSVLPTVLGVPPIAAVGLAAALTAIGVLVDLTRIGNLSTVFTVCHIAGCALAVIWVRRSGLFGPMVQPPLLVAAAVPVVVLLAGSPRPGQGVAEQLLVIGAPLVNAFPVMAWTTGTVLVLGILRMALQRPVNGPSERDEAREAART